MECNLVEISSYSKVSSFPSVQPQTWEAVALSNLMAFLYLMSDIQKEPYLTMSILSDFQSFADKEKLTKKWGQGGKVVLLGSIIIAGDVNFQ